MVFLHFSKEYEKIIKGQKVTLTFSFRVQTFYIYPVKNYVIDLAIGALLTGWQGRVLLAAADR